MDCLIILLCNRSYSATSNFLFPVSITGLIFTENQLTWQWLRKIFFFIRNIMKNRNRVAVFQNVQCITWCCQACVIIDGVLCAFHALRCFLTKEITWQLASFLF